MMTFNLIELLLKNINEKNHKNALYYKINQNYQALSYAQLFEKIIQFSHSLVNLGVKAEQKIAIMLKNCPEWVISDLATISINAIVVPIYETLSLTEKNFILNHCQASVLITDSSHSQDFQLIRKNNKNLNHIICVDQNIKNTLNFNQLISSTYKDFPKNIMNIKNNDILSIVYTSGTTGVSKGVCLSHKNIVSNILSITKRLPLSNNERVLSFLPLSHVFERTAGYYTLLALGGEIFYAESHETVAQNMIESKPTIVVSVPRLYEKIKDKITNNLKGIKKVLFYWALNVGKKSIDKGKKSLSYWLATKLVFNKIKQKTGGNLKFFVSGGAPLSEEIATFFYYLDTLILEGYGMTESSPVIACNHPQDFKFGTVGKPLDCSEIKISDEGELLVKGPHIMSGYYKKSQSFVVDIDDEGWLHTGDLVEIDNEGFIKIIDRKKNIIVLSNGKNIAPQKIESCLIKSRWIKQALCLGNKKSYLTALIVLDDQMLQKFALKNNISYNKEVIINNNLLISQISHEITKLQASHSNYEKIKKFTLISQEFSQENGQLTPTLKPKRKIILETYNQNIKEMYHEK